MIAPECDIGSKPVVVLAQSKSIINTHEHYYKYESCLAKQDDHVI